MSLCECDQSYKNIAQVSNVAALDGYTGGLRVMQAAVHRFYCHMRDVGRPLGDRNFTMAYHTTVCVAVLMSPSRSISPSL